ncbi:MULTISPECIES: MerR family transcriptional regulator [Actinomadura]|uniref:DNA-binding transcriptional regulator, MerR family n=1 Tax=Actinomadura madurae TaxID=1993 RepID=A0A1I5N4H5_9ACTN|nr:MerR family transcriptional regulator [Actinomadura madurae]SFP16654.1 DNA-binding transcriptional regulator, MerR family [Actinomadura madurae]SPT50298.1 Mercuric resistance operon regulatory protein [Actinomadura madurae]
MELTVDELAARAGVTVRTVRFYAGRGLLPPPRLRGRTGLYGPAHLARLELVRELQSLGLTLASIEKHLKKIPLDAPAEDLALQRALLSPWAPERPEELDRDELDRRVGHPLDDETLKRLEALGVVEPLPDGAVRVLSPALLSSSAELARLPMPLETLVASHETVDRYTTALAAELQQVFQDTVVRPYREGGRAPEERERLMEMAGKLKPLMIQSLVTSFQRAVDKAIRQSVPD